MGVSDWNHCIVSLLHSASHSQFIHINTNQHIFFNVARLPSALTAVLCQSCPGSKQ